MANLNDLSREVDRLDRIESNDFDFMDALDHIEAAALETDGEIDTLQEILDRFRRKLNNRGTINIERVRAKDLAEALMRQTLKERVASIKGRNDALKDLTSSLQVEIEKGNKDATLLKRIQEAVENATETVGEVKALVDELEETDGDIKATLKKLIERLSNVSSIFKPQEN